jgi:hypothetical protein
MVLSSWIRIRQERCGLLSLVLLYISKYVRQYDMSKIKVAKSDVHELDRTKDTDEVIYSNHDYEC